MFSAVKLAAFQAHIGYLKESKQNHAVTVEGVKSRPWLTMNGYEIQSSPITSNRNLSKNCLQYQKSDYLHF